MLKAIHTEINLALSICLRILIRQFHLLFHPQPILQDTRLSECLLHLLDNPQEIQVNG